MHSFDYLHFFPLVKMLTLSRLHFSSFYRSHRLHSDLSLSLSLDEFKFRKNPTLRITINRPFSLPPLLLFRFKFKERCNTSEILRKRLSKDYICITHGYLGRADLYNTGEVKYRLSRGFAARFSVDVERASD